MKIIRTTAENQDFIQLVKMLDEYLAYMDGDDHPFYDQYNKTDDLSYCAVVYEEENPVACGALKAFTAEEAELKRMFVIPEFRGKGYASGIIAELEVWAKELGFKSLILETGIKQEEAIKLYEKTFERTENYGPYKGVENSLCFKKNL